MRLGRLVVGELLKRVDSNALVALVRDPSKAHDLADLGVTVRQADYNNPETLAAALDGVDQLLLISSSEVGQRAAQHRAVIKAAQVSGVKFFAYTSVLNAEESSLDLAVEHRDTEQALRESGLSYVLLRNGWYNENYAANLESALEYGAIRGSTGDAQRTLARYIAAFTAMYAPAEAEYKADLYDVDGELVDLPFLEYLLQEARTDLLIQGPSGCGKSLLSVVLANQLCAKDVIPIIVEGKLFEGQLGLAVDREAALLVCSTISKVSSSSIP